MLGTLELILTILLLFFSISAVLWGVYGIVFRIVRSRKESVGFLEIETPFWYNIAFWIIVIPFIILSVLLMLL